MFLSWASNCEGNATRTPATNSHLILVAAQRCFYAFLCRVYTVMTSAVAYICVCRLPSQQLARQSTDHLMSGLASADICSHPRHAHIINWCRYFLVASVTSSVVVHRRTLCHRNVDDLFVFDCSFILVRSSKYWWITFERDIDKLLTRLFVNSDQKDFVM